MSDPANPNRCHLVSAVRLTGITISGRAAGNAALHIAVYPPTTLAEYEASLRPDFETTLRSKAGMNRGRGTLWP